MTVAVRHEVVSDAEGAFEFINRFVGVLRADKQKGIVLKRNDEIIAAALYVENNGTNCFIHLAGKPGRRWLTREFLYWGFHYPFVQCGLKRVTCWVEANNADSIRFVEHIGWKLEAILNGAGKDGVDVRIYAMRREDCKYV